jgi:hypothetical protein
MPILNYTTSITAEKTIGEMQKLLARAKAQSIQTDYDGEGCVSALSFRIPTRFGVLSFLLPANVDAIQIVLQREQVPMRLRTREQAARVAWRITKDWLEAQLALVSAGMADMEQVFLPYAQNERGQTVFETLRESNFRGLALMPSSQPAE